MRNIEELSEDAMLVDGALFVRADTSNLVDCPKCGGDIIWDRKEGFLPRPGCIKCNIWLTKVVIAPR